MYFPFGIPEIYYIVFPTKINHAELPIEIFKRVPFTQIIISIFQIFLKH
jgi:hypothetical protein